jgi:type 1 fimbriae regulatory protein FimE
MYEPRYPYPGVPLPRRGQSAVGGRSLWNALRRPGPDADDDDDRHGLRVSEAIALRWDQVDLKAGLLYVQRLKNGVPSNHPIRGPELRALRQLRRDGPDTPYLFISERGGSMTASNVRKLLTRAGAQAKFDFPVHPHMLRHACGYKLANEGHDTRSLQHYLGHRNIAHTVRYTELAPDRFKGFWKD